MLFPCPFSLFCTFFLQTHSPHSFFFIYYILHFNLQYTIYTSQFSVIYKFYIYQYPMTDQLLFCQASKFVFDTMTPAEEGPFFITRVPASKISAFKIQQNWSRSEQIKFVVFLHQNSKTMDYITKKQKWTLFKLMSNYIRTRNISQCKSYYVQVLKKYKSISEFAEFLKCSIANFSSLFQAFECELIELNNNRIRKDGLGKEKEDGRETQALYISEEGEMMQKIEVKEKVRSRLMQFFYPELEQEKRRRQILAKECQGLFEAWWKKINQLTGNSQRYEQKYIY